MNEAQLFMQDTRDFVDSIEDTVSTRTVNYAKQIYKGVVARTPVYRGRLRNAWTLTRDAPEYKQVLSGGSPESPLPAPKPPNLGRIRKYTKLYISNGQPYAQMVNYGSTKNAPRAMVEVTMANLDV